MKKYLILISFLNSLILFPQDRITGEPFSTRSEVIASNGMVATSHPLATQVGIDILKKGGNAIDAAIAANAAIGLMEPTGNGIGGDLFAIIWIEKEKKLYGLNASGRSPSSLDLDFFKTNNYSSIPAYGPLPVSVPGCVDGWFELNERFGSMKMSSILKPAIEYAENGFQSQSSFLITWNQHQIIFTNILTLKKLILLMEHLRKKVNYLKTLI